MAATYTANDAFGYVKPCLRQMPLEQIQYLLLDRTNRMIWMADAWRWTIDFLANITLASNTQDYTISAPPADFLYLHWAYTSDGTNRKELVPAANLPPANVMQTGDPEMVCRVPGTTTLRVWPVPGVLSGAATQLVSCYKKVATKITIANAGNAGILVMDDEWFQVYLDCLLYHGMVWGFDTRAGVMEYDAATGQKKYTGQLGVAMAGIDEMRRREPLVLSMNRRADPPKRKL